MPSGAPKAAKLSSNSQGFGGAALFGGPPQMAAMRMADDRQDEQSRDLLCMMDMEMNNDMD
jgi:hypothetical protein